MTTVSVPLDSIVQLLKENDYNLDTDFSDGKENIVYSETSVAKPKGGQLVIKPSTGISSYTTNSSQNIFDVCLMTIGDINKVVLMITENEAIFDNINSKVDNVFNVNFNDSDVTDNGFKLAVKKSSINFTTGDINEDIEGFILQENGYYILLEDGSKILY